MDHTDNAAALAAMGAIGLVALLIGLAILILICYLVSKCYTAIPEQNRSMSPGMVWLLLIPCFNIVWNFWVYPGLAKSYKAYFDSKGDTTVGDCGAQIALWYCISTACCIIPFVNWLAGPASLVLLIIFLVKTYDLKSKIKA